MSFKTGLEGKMSNLSYASANDADINEAPFM